jgi:hypothetical protein
MPPTFVPRPPVLPKSRPAGETVRRVAPAPVLARPVLSTMGTPQQLQLRFEFLR